MVTPMLCYTLPSSPFYSFTSFILLSLSSPFYIHLHPQFDSQSSLDKVANCTNIYNHYLIWCTNEHIYLQAISPLKQTRSSQMKQVHVEQARSSQMKQVHFEDLLPFILPVSNMVMKFEQAFFETPKVDPKKVASIILGGGAGTRLFPLTSRRAKPAVPIGGCYRIIDVPMSNCINSGVRKIFILTQFNSFSLNRHLARTYNFGDGVYFGYGFVEIFAATQTPGEAGQKWFQGTADVVRQLWVFKDLKSKDVEHIIILPGDHLYRMNYMNFVQPCITFWVDED